MVVDEAGKELRLSAHRERGHIGAGDGKQGSIPHKNGENVFGANIIQNPDILVIFSYIYFLAKMIPPPPPPSKFSELLRL